jgi:hypothetical protein
VLLWDVTGGAGPTRIATIAGGGDCLAFRPPAGDTLAIAAKHDTTKLWTVTDRTQPVPGASLQGGAARFSPDGRAMATDRGSSVVVLWDVNDLTKPNWIIPLTGSSSPMFGPDSHLLAVETDDGVRLLSI